MQLFAVAVVPCAVLPAKMLTTRAFKLRGEVALCNLVFPAKKAKMRACKLRHEKA